MTNTTTRTATVPAQHSIGSRVAYVLATWPADAIRRDVLRSFLAAGPVKHDPPTRTARAYVRGSTGGSTHNRGSLRMQNTLAALDQAGTVVREGEERVRIVPSFAAAPPCSRPPGATTWTGASPRGRAARGRRP